MNKDEPDGFLRYLKRDPNQTGSAALDLIAGLESRRYGGQRQVSSTAENIEFYAEEQFIRKLFYDEMRCEMPGLPRSTFLMVFSPDGSRVASTHGNHNIYITDIRTGKNIRTLVGHPRTPWCIAFHPTSNQIVASGCLGGQVRIWDLSGGSEVWQTVNQTVIASLAFHPTDRVLVIATYNEVHFWDWSHPEPFVHIATGNPKEKVRFVAFDALGHKLITGISNSPQTRWERVRAPVPVPRQERSVNLYRRRITPRLQTQLNFITTENNNNNNNSNSSTSSALDRERRITMCYRNLVREYELLVQRYLQLYRPPLMIDVGTDPMETIPHTTEPPQPGTSSSTQSCVHHFLPGPSSVTRPGTSSAPEPGNSDGTSSMNDPGPSTSAMSSRNARATTDSISSDSGTEDCGWEDPDDVNRTRQDAPSTSSNAHYLTPSRIFSVLNEASMLLNGNQTPESRKHKATETNQTEPKVKRLKRASPYPGLRNGDVQSSSADGRRSNGGKEDQREAGHSSAVVATASPGVAVEQPSTSGLVAVASTSGSGEGPSTSSRSVPGPSTGPLLLPSTSSGSPNGDSVEQILYNIRRTAEEEVQNRILPIICSVPPNDRPELIRLFENSKKHVHMRYRSMFPVIVKKANKRVVNVVDTTSDSSSSDDDQSMPLSRLLRRNSEPSTAMATSIATRTVQNLTTTTISGTNAGTGNSSVNGDSNVRNFNTELEQLVTSLLTEIERNEIDRANNMTEGEREGFSWAVMGSTRRARPPGPPATTTITTTEHRQQPLSTSLSTLAAHQNSTPPLAPLACQTMTPPSALVVLPNSTSPSVPVLGPNSASASTSTLVTGSNSHLVYPRPFQGYFPRFNLAREAAARDRNDPRTLRTFERPHHESPANNDSRDSSLYGNCLLRRRRFLSHRISAFMPTRVNYNRSPAGMRRVGHSWNRRRPGLTRPFGTTPQSSSPSSSSFGTDELINYSERENSEDDSTQPLDLSNHSTSEEAPAASVSSSDSYSNMRLGNVYANIVHDLESSLSDVIRMRASNRPGETSDMLGSFSERLDNIMQQSDMILRNLSRSMELLGNAAGEPNMQRAQGTTESGWRYYNHNFFPHDQRANGQEASRDEATTNLDNLFSHIQPSNVVAADHTYPRNPEDGDSASPSDNVSSLMTSLHMTISHIQRQARLLRRQVERIERIDRAMVEVAQLQLIRQLIIELVRHVRSNINGGDGGGGSESRNTTTGMSSVRQMMAGTRISDSNPYESLSEEAGGSSRTNPQPSSSTAALDSNAPRTNSGNPGMGRSGPRSSNRKTYPSGRFLRLSRQNRNPSMIHFFSRRYANRNDRAATPGCRNGPPRSTPTRHAFGSSPTRLNAFTLQAMSRRLQLLLMSQVRAFTSPPSATGPNLRSSSPEFGEHLLATSLIDCVNVVNRLTGSNINPNSVSNLTVTQDGEPRYRARRILTGIVETMSRHIEELGFSSIRSVVREQFHGVLVMSLLLTELQLLVIVDSIPPPSGGNLIPERVSLTSRIDQMCNQMLQSRNFTYSHELTRSLRLMKLTMRHAHSALGQTYHARRNEMLPRINTSRQQVIGSINRCLLFINRQRNQETAPSDSSPSTSTAAPQSERPENTDWYSNFYDFFLRRYSNSREEDAEAQPQPSTSRERSGGPSTSRSNDNGTDGDDDDDDYNARFNQNNNNNNYNNNNNNVNGNYNDVQLPYVRYRHCNLNVVNGAPLQQSRLIPSVQLNDVPVSEPAASGHMNHHRRNFSDRLSELRTHPIGLFRPRFLHPLYASVMNPFDADLDDPQREPLYENDMITTVTPNHRIQAWDIADWTMPLPQITDGLKNVVVSECKIHNDASVDVAKDGTILVTLLPSGGYLNVTNRLGVYSLRWETLGQCLYTTSFEQNAVSVSLSPLSRHLVVGLTHRVITSDRWIMARVFKIEQKDVPGDRLPVLRELEQSRECRINCIRWLPTSGQGLIYATNTGQLVVLS